MCPPPCRYEAFYPERLHYASSRTGWLREKKTGSIQGLKFFDAYQLAHANNGSGTVPRQNSLNQHGGVNILGIPSACTSRTGFSTRPQSPALRDPSDLLKMTICNVSRDFCVCSAFSAGFQRYPRDFSLPSFDPDLLFGSSPVGAAVLG